MRHIVSSVHLSVREGTVVPYKPQKGVQTPPHVPTPETLRVVECGAINGTPTKVLAQMLDINEQTLLKHYGKLMATARDVFNATCTSKLRSHYIDSEELYERDPKAHLTALTFALKTKGGWKETQVVEQETTHKVDDGTLAKMKSLDIDDLINLGKGLEKSEG